GDDMILKRMKRRHLRDDAIRFCDDVRRRRPDVVFGADIIAGFPTETDEMFENSLRLVEECGLTWLHVFPFSARQGTPAAKMPQVAKSVRKERAARLRASGDARVRDYLAAQTGRSHRVLMERPQMGRTEGFAEVHFNVEHTVGSVVDTKIVGATATELTA
ncbi:MAG: tRNA (N(6)-L-threonylcarbamoyladenosine(37)-C(2))-methylthiotransferase MtaB, partial [Pseudomonadota bacterium]